MDTKTTETVEGAHSIEIIIIRIMDASICCSKKSERRRLNMVFALKEALIESLSASM